jgi:putative MATE family efflux protein
MPCKKMRSNRVERFLKNPKKALFTLATPLLIGMIFQVLYNVVDTAFVGRLGAEAIAALTFSFPLFFLLMALNSGVGAGMGSRIARYLGAKNKKQAENTAMHGLLMSLMLAIIVFVLGWFTLEPLFSLFGASQSVVPLALDYMRIILMSVFFLMPAMAMHSLYTSQGDTRTPVKVQASALALNAALDPIFIFVLGMGVKGAATATLIAFLFSLVLQLYFLRTRSYLRLSPRAFRFSPAIVREILRVGAPASLMMIIMSVYVMFINRFMAHFSTNHVASFGLASRLESFATMPIFAFSLSLMTLTGMFYGARRYDLLKSTVWYGIRVTIGLTSVVGLAFFILPELFLRIFTPDPMLLSIGAGYLRIDVFTFPLMAGGMCISRVMQGMGFGLPGLIVNLTRVLFVAVPLAYIFVYILGFGYLSIAVAMVVGGVVSNIVAYSWISIKLRNLYKPASNPPRQ